ncbi:MAG: isoprenylcysteine carboxylmethyltransferase family protein [Tabrizicola sp.]|uniref:methyltransferase family protein n=1 Tax=Tabrizicola sp. TaxID=2005166 RepID=UPI002735A7A1|nr:isoprenylcysteine carboxylmethyltransferase family protein [Tabrizicola sp.]MDP3648047.1 isoprenylcysteine carboxylmethyltransferase family protein [Paracoccaceae bacterium]MDZ4069669.1 isoprenylcysteine carboxylmethyltransferase family protein [Tabrizicola sp.]
MKEFRVSSSSRSVPVNQLIRVNILRATFVLSLPLAICAVSPWSGLVRETMNVAGIGLVVAAVLGRFWSILYIGGHKNMTVMQDGPYSICRHPLYLFSTIGVLGFGLMLGSVVLTLFLGGMTLAILSITARKEEAFLRGQFGPTYDAYAARVPMIVPRLSGFKTQATVVVSVHHLRHNLMDALVFLTFIPLARLLDHVQAMEIFPSFSIW